MSERGTIDAVFIFRRMPEEYHAKGKRLYIIIIMVIFKCYFSGEHIALSINK